MGLDFSFNLVVPIAAIDEVLTQLAARLCGRDRARLLAALPWRPSQERIVEWKGALVQEGWGVGRIEHSDDERDAALCLAPLVDMDQAVLAHENRRGMPLPREGGLACFGCMWTSFYAGSRFFVISSTAATSDMSRLCESSDSIQAPWKELASATSALALFLDTEQERTWTLLHPTTRTVERPDEELFELFDDCRPGVDAYWSDALARACILEEG